eukprot:TRINITY_DN1107_c1_g2_i9.p1 TRINITY_DN1107_c1_g2~~TRINITY_DN1107_c1_g2_i9.p1  ORF type:complete len:366 (-),score=65.75 TRINITY_DN1107_c1_g2_i9:801-1898(-)
MNDRMKQAAIEEYQIMLDQFLESDDIVYHFPSHLNKLERAIIHDMAEELSLLHYSNGIRRERHIVVAKHPPILDGGVYDHKQGQWVSIPSDAPDIVECDNFTVLNLNVLFEGIGSDISDIICTDIRIPAIFKFLEEQDASIITLQEVTPDFYNFLLEQSWVKDKYYISDRVGSSITPSGNFLLSQFHISKNYQYYYTKSPKCVVFSEIIINDKVLSVGVVHLKAGNRDRYSRTRRSDIIDTMSVQDKIGFDFAILIGDFNFRNKKEGYSNHETVPELEERYTDVWKYCKPGEAGITHDVENNLMAKELSIRVYQKNGKVGSSNRFDRLYYKHKFIDEEPWEPLDIQIVANQPIGKITILNYIDNL